MKSSAKKYHFKAILEKADDSADTAFVKIPLDIKKEFGTNGQIKVRATFDGVSYRGVLANMGKGGHLIGVRKDIRKEINKGPGDVVQVTITQDLEERVVSIPVELAAILSKNKKASLFFDALSFTNKKEYALWIAGAKKEETKKKRLGLIVEKLLAGKKNPSEK